MSPRSLNTMTPEDRLTELEQQVLALWRTIRGEREAPHVPEVTGLEPVPEFPARATVSEKSVEDFRRVANQIASEIEGRQPEYERQ